MPVVAFNEDEDWFARKAVFRDLLLRAKEYVVSEADRYELRAAQALDILDLTDIPADQAKRLALAVRSAAATFRRELETKEDKTTLETELIPSFQELEEQLNAFVD